MNDQPEFPAVLQAAPPSIRAVNVGPVEQPVPPYGLLHFTSCGNVWEYDSKTFENIDDAKRRAIEMMDRHPMSWRMAKIVKNEA